MKALCHLFISFQMLSTELSELNRRARRRLGNIRQKLFRERGKMIRFDVNFYLEMLVLATLVEDLSLIFRIKDFQWFHQLHRQTI